MVFLTNLLQKWRFSNGYIHRPDSFHKRMQVLDLLGHRRCYKLAIQRLHKAFQHSNRSRQIKSLLYKETWQTRLDAACKEHGLNYFEFVESLTRQNIQLNHNVLANIAINEPRTFQSLCTVAKQHIINTNLYDLKLDQPEGVYNRTLFVDETNQ